ncbi:MAG: hypothetical protein ACREDF_00740 [Thermoplasmata archaeon]
MILGIALLTAIGPPASATDFAVISTPYQVNHTLASDTRWNTYELTASIGQQVKYSITITTTGACASLLFIKGHNPGLRSEYFVTYSKESCVQTYSNSFPVEPNDGTTFSVLIETTYTGDVSYFLAIDILAPLVPTWLLGIGIVAIIGILPVLVYGMWSRWKIGPIRPPTSVSPRPASSPPDFPAPSTPTPPPPRS